MTALPEPRMIACSSSTATVYEHGAHVVSWVPSEQSDVLWMSASSAFDSAAPLRGGIPICLPWFGAGPAGVLTPAHGFARLSDWRMVDGTTAPGEATAVFELTSADIDDGIWPYPFTARYEIRVGPTLRTALTMCNEGDEPFSVEEALHTYLAVGDVRQVWVHGLDGAGYRDKVIGADAIQRGDLVITGETDRVYSSSSDLVVVDPVLRRRIRVRKSGSASTVVWNPWIDKAAAMPDFGDDEWPQMLCVEAANVLADAVMLRAGESHTIVSELVVEP